MQAFYFLLPTFPGVLIDFQLIRDKLYHGIRDNTVQIWNECVKIEINILSKVKWKRSGAIYLLQ